MATRVNTNDFTTDVISPFFALDLEFDSPNQVYLWTGYGDKTIGSNTYAGAGELLRIEPITETSDIQATGAVVSLAGADSTLITRALATPYHGRVARIHFGLVGSESSMTEVFSGFMDQMIIDEDPGSGTITLTIENKLVSLERPLGTRYTAALQKERHTGDKGLDFVESMATKKIIWGAVPEDV